MGAFVPERKEVVAFARWRGDCGRAGFTLYCKILDFARQFSAKKTSWRDGG
jgi:hypothetical protein